MNPVNISARNLSGYFQMLGVGFLLFGITANVLLYLSFSDTFGYQLIYGTLGAGLDLWKAGALLAAMILWYRGDFGLAVFSAVMFVVLTAISIGAGFGFTQQMMEGFEQRRLMESNQFKSLEAKLESAEARVAELSGHADLNPAALQTELDALLNAPALNMHGQPAGTVSGNVGNCSGGGYYVSKHCPAILALQAKLDGANAYAGAKAFEREARAELAALDGANVNKHHPMFVGLAGLLGTSAEEAKYRFFIISIIVIELLGTVSIFMSTRLRNDADPMQMTLAEMLAQQQAAQQVSRQMEALQPLYPGSQAINPK